MKNMIDRLAECENDTCTEWIGIYDERLIEATGEPAPNRGCTTPGELGGKAYRTNEWYQKYHG